MWSPLPCCRQPAVDSPSTGGSPLGAEVALEVMWRCWLLGDRPLAQRTAETVFKAGLREGHKIAEWTGRIMQVSAELRVQPVVWSRARLQALAGEAQAAHLPRMQLLAEDSLAALDMMHGDPLAAYAQACSIQQRSRMAARSPAERGFSLYVAVQCGQVAGRQDEAMRFVTELLQVSRELGHEVTVVAAWTSVAFLHQNFCSDPKEGLEAAERAWQIASRLPPTLARVNALIVQAGALAAAGRAREAVALIEEEQALPGMARQLLVRRTKLARIYLADGQLEKAADQLSPFTPPPPGDFGQESEWRLANAELALAAGQHERVVDLVSAALSIESGLPRSNPDVVLGLHLARCRALTALGRSELARLAVEQAQRDLHALIPKVARVRYVLLDVGLDVGAARAPSPSDARRLRALEEAVTQPPPAAPPAEAPAPRAPGRVPPFVAHVSHELRTPLHGVLGLAELLRRSPLDAQQRRHAEALQRSAQTMLQVVNDLLDLARLERGRFVLTLAPLALDPWLAETVQPFVELGRERGLAVTWHAQPGLPQWVLADGLRLRQVLGNLLDNALKFTEQGQVTVRARWLPLSASRIGSGSGLLQLEVSDTGRGIHAEAQARLFREFEQGEADDGHQGSGLGLALCRQLLGLMGGSIRLHSRPRHGSRFVCEVPLPVVRGGAGPVGASKLQH